MTSQNPLFKITILVRLPWGSRGHDKSKNPVNHHNQCVLSPENSRSALENGIRLVLRLLVGLSCVVYL